MKLFLPEVFCFIEEEKEAAIHEKKRIEEENRLGIFNSQSFFKSKENKYIFMFFSKKIKTESFFFLLFEESPYVQRLQE
jgi:hypothetical protein